MGKAPEVRLRLFSNQLCRDAWEQPTLLNLPSVSFIDHDNRNICFVSKNAAREEDVGNFRTSRKIKSSKSFILDLLVLITLFLQ
jgi:hypothetical protein